MATTQPTQFPSFTVYVKGSPVTFTSAFADLAAAYHALAAHVQQSGRRNDFAESLLGAARARKLSPSQAAWLHKLATDIVRPETRTLGAAVANLDVSSLLVLLDRAAAADKKFPKIQLPAEGGAIEIARNTKRPPVVAVVAGGRWPNREVFAEITPDGVVHQRSGWTHAIEQLVRVAAANPELVLALHGVATGQCCYCQRALSTAESRTVGYGPVCAEKFGLPWGDTTAADEADLHAKAELAKEQLRALMNPPAPKWTGLDEYYDSRHPNYTGWTGD